MRFKLEIPPIFNIYRSLSHCEIKQLGRYTSLDYNIYVAANPTPG